MVEIESTYYYKMALAQAGKSAKFRIQIGIGVKLKEIPDTIFWGLMLSYLLLFFLLRVW